MDYKREDWLAIRDSGSLGQCLRARSRFIHVSKLLADGLISRVVSTQPGRTLNIGRNAAKRAAKAAR